MDTVYLYDISHFRRVCSTDGFLDIGEMIVNEDNRTKIIKYGFSPCDLLPYYESWKEKSKQRKPL